MRGSSGARVSFGHMENVLRASGVCRGDSGVLDVRHESAQRQDTARRHASLAVSKVRVCVGIGVCLCVCVGMCVCIYMCMHARTSVTCKI
jgi:hypothetical protein